jgi:ceramide glucosyltransferase
MILALLPSLALGAYVLVTAWKSWAAFAYARGELGALREAAEGTEPYDLTVLQPVLSGDPTLEASLRTNLEMHGGDAAFHLLVDDDDAEAQRVTAKLQRPGVTIKSYSAAEPGVNPKVDKLERAFADVVTEFVAVLDDDTTVGPLHMRRAIEALRREGCEGGLYTGLPTYRAELSSGQGWSDRVGAGLIAAFVNSSSALTYLPAAHAAPPITLNGMFYVTRSEVLRSIGGFTAIREELCDDLAMAQLYRRADRTIHQGAMAQLLMTGGMGFGAYVTRMHRWFVFAKVLVRRASQSERVRLGITLGAPPVLLWIAALGALTSWPRAAALGAVLFLRHAVLASLLRVTREVREPGGHAAKLHPVSSVLSELLMPFHAIHAALRPTIRWRTRRMRVRRDGSFESLGERT